LLHAGAAFLVGTSRLALRRRDARLQSRSFAVPQATFKFKAGKIMRQRVGKLSRELKEKEASGQQKTAAPHDQR
jgi:hypothetical protein